MCDSSRKLAVAVPASGRYAGLQLAGTVLSVERETQHHTQHPGDSSQEHSQDQGGDQEAPYTDTRPRDKERRRGS